VEVYGGETESVDRSIESGLGVRTVSGGKAGFAWTCDLSDSGLSRVISESLSNALAGDESDADVLADAHAGRGSTGEARKYPNDFPPEPKIEGALEMEAAALRADPRVKSIEGAVYSEVTGTVCIGSTRGLLRTRRGGFSSCSLGAAAAEGPEMRSGWYYSQAPLPGDLDFRMTGREAGMRASMLLGGEPLPTKRYSVVFDQFAFAEVLGLLCEMLSAEMVVKGSTLLGGMLGEKIASEVFTLVDDPLLEGACLEFPFDDEGVPASRRELVSDGVLKGFLHSSYTARRTGAGAAGNAFRDSFKSLPSPGPSNLFVMPGPGDRDALVRSLDSGILIQDVMGIHTADPVSGDFSVGIDGFEVSAGTTGRPVCEMTISGNVLSLLGGIAAAGSGLSMIGRVGSPPVLVEGLSVSGR
jgi:PmbA protein